MTGARAAALGGGRGGCMGVSRARQPGLGAASQGVGACSDLLVPTQSPHTSRSAAGRGQDRRMKRSAHAGRADNVLYVLTNAVLHYVGVERVSGYYRTNEKSKPCLAPRGE